jgi:hypothetical protein
MSNEVYANGNEVSCKAAAGKSICAFPDVCFTPPLTPATPPGVPVPYPNTGMASDSSDGSKTVQISGMEVMKKDSSYFKQSTGDEAGSAPKKNVVTSTIKGKCYYIAWSMNVKIEGENAVRHLDMMTHNHASGPGGTPPWVYQDMPAEQRDKCLAQDQDATDKCAATTPHLVPKTVKGKDGKPDKLVQEQKGLDCPPGCEEAKACILAPYKDGDKYCCHPNTTPHHLIEVHCFTRAGGRGEASESAPRLDEYLDYNDGHAPCVCANESASDGPHGVMHDVQGSIERGYAQLRSKRPLKSWGPGPLQKSYWNYGEARDTGATAHKRAYPHCDRECTKRQLDAYHQDHPRGPQCSENAPMRTDPVNRH